MGTGNASLLAVILAFCLSQRSSDCLSQYGDHFIVALPFTDAATHGHTPSSLRLVLVNPWNTAVTLNATTQGTVLAQYTVDATSSSVYTITMVPMLPGTGLSSRTLVLMSASTFGVLVLGTEAYDGYLAMPVSSWGRAYVAATPPCPAPDSSCQLVVLAHAAATAVTVTIPSANNDFAADDPGLTYASEVTETQVLGANQAWVLSRPYDLSGAKVTGNASVGVLAGAQWTTIQGSGGAVTEQLPPQTALGSEFVTLAGPDYVVRVVTTEPDTTCTPADADPFKIEAARSWFQAGLNSSVHVRSDRPVLVVQFGRLKNGQAGTPFPFFVVLTPVVQFLGKGHSGLQPDTQHTKTTLVVVTRKKFRTSVLVSGVALTSKSIFNTSTEGSDYDLDHVVTVHDPGASVSQAQKVSSGLGQYGLYLQAVSDDCVSVTPMGVLYDVVNPERDCGLTTPQKAGDQVDNDCDGQVDEDDCGSSSGTDCGYTYTGPPSSHGHRFVVAIPDIYSDSTLAAQVTLTTISPNDATVSIAQTSMPIPTNVTVTSTGPVSTTLDRTNVMTSNRSSAVTIISSSSPISATFHMSALLDNSFLSAGSMKLIPEEALGREYFVVSFSREAASAYFQVIGVYPNTRLEMSLSLTPASTATVVFEDNVYSDGDVIRTNITQYEALQIGCPAGCTMTGSRVTASKPVAVYFMSDAIRFGISLGAFMEQMPPKESLGRDYIVRQQPTRMNNDTNYCNFVGGCEDYVWIVASRAETEVLVARSPGGHASVYELDSAGDLLEVRMASDLMQIRADKGILVVQSLQTLSENRGALLVVVPVEQYAGRDVVMFDLENLSKDKQLAIHTADDPPPEILVADVIRPYNQTVFGPLLNVSSLMVSFAGSGTTSWTEVIASGGGVFGGYVSDLGVGESITSFSHTLRRINLPCVVTKAVHGDGVDNDCDGLFDEEPCLPNTTEDTDYDGRYNEDCQELPASSSISLVSTLSSLAPATSAPSIAATASAIMATASSFYTIASSPSWTCLYDLYTSSTTTATQSSGFSATTVPTSSWSCSYDWSSDSSDVSLQPTATAADMTPSLALSDSWSCESDSISETSIQLTQTTSLVASTPSWSCTSDFTSSSLELETSSIFASSSSWTCLSDLMSSSLELETSSVSAGGSSWSCSSDLTSSSLGFETSSIFAGSGSWSCSSDFISTSFEMETSSALSSSSSWSCSSDSVSTGFELQTSSATANSGTWSYLGDVSTSTVEIQTSVLADSAAWSYTQDWSSYVSKLSTMTTITTSSSMTHIPQSSTVSTTTTSPSPTHVSQPSTVSTTTTTSPSLTQQSSEVQSPSVSLEPSMVTSSTAGSVSWYLSDLISTASDASLSPPSLETSTSASPVPSPSSYWFLSHSTTGIDHGQQSYSSSTLTPSADSYSPASSSAYSNQQPVLANDPNYYMPVSSQSIATAISSQPPTTALLASSHHPSSLPGSTQPVSSVVLSSAFSTHPSLSPSLSTPTTTALPLSSSSVVPTLSSLSCAHSMTNSHGSCVHATTATTTAETTTEVATTPETTTESETTTEGPAETTTEEVTTTPGSQDTTTTEEEPTTEDTTTEEPDTTTPDDVTTPEDVTTPLDSVTPSVETSWVDSSSSSSEAASGLAPTPTPTLPAEVSTPPFSVPSSLCGCRCSPWTSPSLSSAVLPSVLQSLVTELTVEKEALSSTRRKKESAEDNRPSAQTVGYLGLAIIVAVGVGIFVLDAGTLFKDFSRLVAACKAK